MLSVGASDLNIILVCYSFELRHIFCKIRQMDVDGGAKCCTKVGWAGRDEAEVLRVGEFSLLFNLSTGSTQSSKDSADVSTLLHANNP